MKKNKDKLKMITTDNYHQPKNNKNKMKKKDDKLKMITTDIYHQPKDNKNKYGSHFLDRCRANKKKWRSIKRCTNANANANANGNANANANANANGNANAISISHFVLTNAISGFVVDEILCRLPVKSLMRFKSVCKRWMSTIQRDHHFHQLHYNHSTTRPSADKTLLGYHDTVFGRLGYFYSAVGPRHAATTICHFLEPEELSRFIQPINGLICVVDCIEGLVCVYNPSTKEQTEWINPTSSAENDGPVTYVLGFDPVTKKHKVFSYGEKAGSCEVWTLGDKSFRRIDELPRYKLPPGQGIYVTGAMYWLNELNHERCDGTPDVLVAFDVGSEKFRTIPIPDFIFDQPMEPIDQYKWCGQRIFLLRVDGHVAVFCRRDKNTVSMWVLLDADVGHDWKWTQVTIVLPFDWAGSNQIVSFHSVPGMTGEILIRTFLKHHHSYSYNWKKNAFRKLKMSTRSTSDMSEPFAQSLFPVKYYN